MLRETAHEIAFRISRLIANVMIPYLCYKGKGFILSKSLSKLPKVPLSSVVKLMVTRLFAKETQTLKSLGIAEQQGLLHIYKTFCVQDRSGCRQCVFPDLLKSCHHRF